MNDFVEIHHQIIPNEPLDISKVSQSIEGFLFVDGNNLPDEPIGTYPQLDYTKLNKFIKHMSKIFALKRF